jgi:uncharacterized protein (DUF2252 family)
MDMAKAKSKQLSDRHKQGRLARQQTPRALHAEVGEIRRNPVDLLKESSGGRVPSLIPLRYGRMLESPFAFFRGSAIIQAHDLARTPRSGIFFQICGDCHLANFGGFATPERSLAFDINDFDETAPGPWEWDMKRLAASFAVAARQFGHGDELGGELVHEMVNSYRDHTETYAGMSVLDIWYERITYDRLAEQAGSSNMRQHILGRMERASRRTHENMLPKLAEEVNGRWRIRDAPPSVFHIKGKSTLFTPTDDWMGVDNWLEKIAPSLQEYLGTLSSERAAVLKNFEAQDLAFKVAGVGSVGTRCVILLLTDHKSAPLFLQFKEAGTSVIAKYFKSPSPVHNGRRVVEGQRLMQAATDAFLGWSTGPFGRHLYGRQLRDMKIAPEPELYTPEKFTGYARICGWALARAHAKAGGRAAEVSGYIGKGDALADAMEIYALSYADQVEADYEVFRKACRSGRLEARTDADIQAELGLS